MLNLLPLVLVRKLTSFFHTCFISFSGHLTVLDNLLHFLRHFWLFFSRLR